MVALVWLFLSNAVFPLKSNMIHKVVPNQFTMGFKPELVDGAVPPQDWAASCSTQSQAPVVPGPPSCINSDSMKVARDYSSMGYCMSQTTETVPNQVLGCSVDISTGTKTCSSSIPMPLPSTLSNVDSILELIV